MKDRERKEPFDYITEIIRLNAEIDLYDAIFSDNYFRIKDFNSQGQTNSDCLVKFKAENENYAEELDKYNDMVASPHTPKKNLEQKELKLEEILASIKKPRHHLYNSLIEFTKALTAEVPEKCRGELYRIRSIFQRKFMEKDPVNYAEAVQQFPRQYRKVLHEISKDLNAEEQKRISEKLLNLSKADQGSFSPSANKKSPSM